MQSTTERNSRGGVRFLWGEPPLAGEVLKCHDGRAMTFKEIGPAGMLLCEDASGCEQLLFPHDVEAVTPNVGDERRAKACAARFSTSARSTG